MAGKVVVSTLNDDAGVLATQNGMTGIAKAWVNFDGTGTPAIRGSFNVSSITDNGTGDYTVNFTTAMPNANYAVASSGQLDNAGAANGDIITNSYRSATSHTTTSYRAASVNSAGVVTDAISYEITVFSS